MTGRHSSDPNLAGLKLTLTIHNAEDLLAADRNTGRGGRWLRLERRMQPRGILVSSEMWGGCWGIGGRRPRGTHLLAIPQYAPIQKCPKIPPK